jgi:uncharacterized paraquat-inducible protein A
MVINSNRVLIRLGGNSMEFIYGLLVFFMPVFILIILILLILLNKKFNSFTSLKDHNVETLKNLHSQQIISSHQMEKLIKEYKRKTEIQILTNLQKEGILTDEKFTQITKALEEKQKQEKSQELTELKIRLGDDDVVYLPEQQDSAWKCTCGTINHENDNNCEKCRRNKDYLFEVYNYIKSNLK